MQDIIVFAYYQNERINIPGQEMKQGVEMKTGKIFLLIAITALIAAGCTEQYAGNPQLGALYRVLNYDTTYKERALLFEMEDHTSLTREGKFYIMGEGISNPGSYSCAPK